MPVSDDKVKRLTVRLSHSEYAKLKEQADERGLNVNAYINGVSNFNVEPPEEMHCVLVRMKRSEHRKAKEDAARLRLSLNAYIRRCIDRGL
jgi:predicted HicB family RNase H-like nuclease